MSLSRPSTPRREPEKPAEKVDLSPPTAADDLLPVTVERRIQELVGALDKALEGWRTLFGEYKRAEREYDAAYAMAKINVDKDVPYNDRGQHAQLAVMEQREAKDIAEEALKYAEHRLDAIKKALSAWQSIANSVRTAYLNAR
ncbi:hypothetical protein LITTLEE_120 [Mycobacterium phage LittleE]|uniref:Uncharacterized protein n=1 Tax=Mycobacterium phage LittleE TaxID=2922212 RepID=G1D405_9CAUD|nr:hypothetical protein FGG27_gp120 [Mycobacterium phage LittleE]AEK09500.1 hypothetical protein LITTLEE_120 [Mycobacterium phage LittleE]